MSRRTRRPGRNLPLRLLRAREALFAQFRPVLLANRVTEQQWRVIRQLAEHDALEPRELCELCRISSPSMAGVLARMAQLGLVSRRPVAGDQRRLRVALTARGRRLAARMLPEIEAVYRKLEAKLGAEFIDRFHAMLDELISTLTREAGADGR